MGLLGGHLWLWRIVVSRQTPVTLSGTNTYTGATTLTAGASA